jgi:hypothetical protein
MLRSTLAITLTVLAAGVASAQDEDTTKVETLDLTMTLMPPGATLPDAVTRVIELPAAVTEEAVRENAARGLDQANAARERREDGLATAAEAGEQGRERAQDARENMGRGGPGFDGPPGPPDVPGNSAGDPPGGGPPDSPGPPDVPGPPGN